MDGFCDLVRWILKVNEMPETTIHTREKLTLPGFYRPTKKWDLLVVHEHQLVAAIELKSQTSPSFGKNFNNRAEEAIGTATDLWEAYEKGAFGLERPRPWVGLLMLLEDCPGTLKPRTVNKENFHIFPEFQNTSYAQRYEILMRKLVLQKLLDGASLILTKKTASPEGSYEEPTIDLSIKKFLAGLAGHVRTFMSSL